MQFRDVVEELVLETFNTRGWKNRFYRWTDLLDDTRRIHGRINNGEDLARDTFDTFVDTLMSIISIFYFILDEYLNYFHKRMCYIFSRVK